MECNYLHINTRMLFDYKIQCFELNGTNNKNANLVHKCIGKLKFPEDWLYEKEIKIMLLLMCLERTYGEKIIKALETREVFGLQSNYIRELTKNMRHGILGVRTAPLEDKINIEKRYKLTLQLVIEATKRECINLGLNSTYIKIANKPYMIEAGTIRKVTLIDEYDNREQSEVILLHPTLGLKMDKYEISLDGTIKRNEYSYIAMRDFKKYPVVIASEAAVIESLFGHGDKRL